MIALLDLFTCFIHFDLDVLIASHRDLNIEVGILLNFHWSFMFKLYIFLLHLNRNSSVWNVSFLEFAIISSLKETNHITEIWNIWKIKASWKLISEKVEVLDVVHDN